MCNQSFDFLLDDSTAATAADASGLHFTVSAAMTIAYHGNGDGSLPMYLLPRDASSPLPLSPSTALPKPQMIAARKTRSSLVQAAAPQGNLAVSESLEERIQVSNLSITEKKLKPKPQSQENPRDSHAEKSDLSELPVQTQPSEGQTRINDLPSAPANSSRRSSAAAPVAARADDSGVASDQLPGVVEYEKLPRALVEHRGGGLAAAVGDLDEVDTKPESEGGGGGLSVSSVTLVTQLSLDRFAAPAALKSTKLGPLISIVIS